MKMRIVVSSHNPVKINAATFGFQTFFPNEPIETISVRVPSGVSDQPMSEGETLSGAKKRVENAKKIMPDADYWIGIEGGIEENEDELEAFAWVYILSKRGKIGRGKTGSFFLPEKVRELIKQGKELGEADDIVFSQVNSKQKQGSVGILTKDVIDRTDYYKPAVVFALIPFINPELY